MHIANLPKSSFYYHHQDRPDPDAADKALLVETYRRHKGRYGQRRIAAALGWNRKKAARLIKQPRPKENPMRPLITALILLAACTDSNPNIHEPPAMTASPSQAPDQTEQPNGKTLLRQAQQQYDGYYKYQAAYLAYQAAQAGETLSPHLAELAKNY